MTGTGWSDVPVAESAVAPPGPIPNPVVTRGSAGEYCRGDSVGGEAAAGTSDQPVPVQAPVTRGGAVAARWAHNPKVGGSNPSPATNPPVGRCADGLGQYLKNVQDPCDEFRRRGLFVSCHCIRAR